jgi:hypothetical protein
VAGKAVLFENGTDFRYKRVSAGLRQHRRDNDYQLAEKREADGGFQASHLGGLAAQL